MPVLCTAYHKVFLMLKMNNIKKEDYSQREVLFVSLWEKMFVYISLSFRDVLKQQLMIVIFFVCVLLFFCLFKKKKLGGVLLSRLYTCPPSPLHTLKRKLISLYYYLIISTHPSPNPPTSAATMHTHTHKHTPSSSRQNAHYIKLMT